MKMFFDVVLLFLLTISFPVCALKTILFAYIKCCVHRFVIYCTISFPLSRANSWNFDPFSVSIFIISAFISRISVFSFIPAALRRSNSDCKSLYKHWTNSARLRPRLDIFFILARLRLSLDENEKITSHWPEVESAFAVFLAFHQRLAFCMLDLSFPGKRFRKCLTHLDYMKFSQFSLANAFIQRVAFNCVIILLT